MAKDDATRAAKCPKCGMKFVSINTYDGLRCPQCGRQGKLISVGGLADDARGRRKLLAFLLFLIAVGLLIFLFYWRFLRRVQPAPGGENPAPEAQEKAAAE